MIIAVDNIREEQLMPPKDTQPPVLFFSHGGEKAYKPLGNITEANLIVDDLIPDGEIELPFIKPNEKLVFSCEFSIRDNPSMFMLLATGKWPSNNWLKMHGYPMRRKRANDHRSRQSPKRRQARHKAQSADETWS